MCNNFVDEHRKKLVSKVEQCLKSSILEEYSYNIEIEWKEKFSGYYELIGWCNIGTKRRKFLYASVEYSEIKKFFVSNPIRKQGIGKLAMRFLFDIFKNKGLDNLFVIPYAYNTMSNDITNEINIYFEQNEVGAEEREAFYENMGFEREEGSDPLRMYYNL